MTDASKQIDDDLNAFFQAARDEKPEPDAELMSRILADAAVIGADHHRAHASRGETAPPAGSWFSRFSELFGGFEIAVPAFGCFAIGMMIGLNGGADFAILQGLDVILGAEDIVAMGYAIDGVELIGTETGL
ncbi:hypothetical protein [Pontivivens insulae]|nr:hypothetical protein [Pontivivens insulae]